MTSLGLILGLVFLVGGGNMLVGGSVQLARKLGVSSLLIGLTLVGFGTSTPELTTSVLAAWKGSAGISIGNVVGSNIANILLVLGTAAMISPVHVDMKSFRRDGAFLAFSTACVILACWLGHIGFIFGTILTATLIGYVMYSYISDKKEQKQKKENTEPGTMPVWKALGTSVIGIALTILGAKLLVDSAIVLARDWNVSEAVIGLTVVAVGTSLPELATSIISALRKADDVAFGNVVGSNIYNSLFILGVTALLIPITVPTKMTQDVAMMTVVTAVLIGIACWRKQFDRLTGALFLIAYAVYTYMLF